MDHSELANHFKEVGEALAGKGHLVLIRKARELLENGDGAGATNFLEGASSKTKHDGLSALAGQLRAWVDAGGDATALTADAAWTRGRASESRAANLIGSATTGTTNELIESLATQTWAQAAGEPVTDVEAPAAAEPEPMVASEEAPADAPPPAADEPPAPAAPANSGPPTGALPPPAPYDGPNGYVTFAVGMAILALGYVVLYSVFT
jgi:hypothetical protein